MSITFTTVTSSLPSPLREGKIFSQRAFLIIRICADYRIKQNLKIAKRRSLCKKSGVTHKSALDERGNEVLDRGAELRMMNDEMNFGSVAL